MKESNILKLVHRKLSEMGLTMFRINVGRAWTGNKIHKLLRGGVFISKGKPFRINVPPGSILILDPRPFRVGVPNGYPDLSGLSPVKITKEHVGMTLPIFTVVEVKTDIGKLTPEQVVFFDFAKNKNCLTLVARSEKDCEGFGGINCEDDST